MSTKPFHPAAFAAGLLGAAAAITVLAAVALSQDRGSFAKGVIIGGTATILVMAFLWWRGHRGGTAAHLASGIADERERRLFRDAVADGGLAMFAAALVGAIWSLFGAEAIAVVGVVLWVGLIAWAVSLAVRSRAA